MRLLSICTLALLGVVAAAAAPLNDLYVGLDSMRGYAPVYWWFLSDGRFLNALPANGVSAADFNAGCSTHPGFCGAYTLSGNRLSMRYNDGHTQEWTYKPLNGGFMMNYLILAPVQQFPSGTKLNGTWDKPGVGATFYSFHPDGTYSYKFVSAYGTTDQSGTYSISGYSLTLTGQNGGRHMVFPVSGGNLAIDGVVYTKEK